MLPVLCFHPDQPSVHAPGELRDAVEFTDHKYEFDEATYPVSCHQRLQNLMCLTQNVSQCKADLAL